MHHIRQSTQSYCRVKKYKQNLRENHSKRTEIAIAACQFSKFFRESMSPDPLEPLLFLNQLQTSSDEKNTLEKNVEIMPLSLLKFFASPVVSGRRLQQRLQQT